MNIKTANKLIVSMVMAIAFTFVSGSKVSADCESTYGGGETCVYNKRFKIEKKVVKLDDDDLDDWKDEAKDKDDWEDKVTDVEKDEIVVFKIKIKNESDEGTDDFDDMKMLDELPDELEKIGGSGLTEYWDDFEEGESETFYIVAEVKDDEYDRDENFEDCVVNEARVYWDGEFEGEDTATVCFGEEEVTELPDTGATSEVALFGLGMILIGTLIRTGIKFLS